MPDNIAVTAGHGLQALEEMTPSEIMRLEVLALEVTAPRQITDVNSLRHVSRVSLRREQRSYCHLIILTVLCTYTFLGFLCYYLRFHLSVLI